MLESVGPMWLGRRLYLLPDETTNLSRQALELQNWYSDPRSRKGASGLVLFCSAPRSEAALVSTLFTSRHEGMPAAVLPAASVPSLL
jgi:hypothetical protein